MGKSIYLRPGETLQPLERLTSGDGRFFLIMGPDGNLVLQADHMVSTGTGAELWSAQQGKPENHGVHLEMTREGNLVGWRPNGEAAYEFAHAYDGGCPPGAYLFLQDDGNLMVIDENAPRADIWRSNTDCRARNDQYVVAGQLAVCVHNSQIFPEVTTGTAEISNTLDEPISVRDRAHSAYVHVPPGGVCGFARDGSAPALAISIVLDAGDKFDATTEKEVMRNAELRRSGEDVFPHTVAKITRPRLKRDGGNLTVVKDGLSLISFQ